MNKKQIVIEKARELFTKYGFKKVSMDEIANEANVTKKTIYTYFKDKQDLFKYFITEELDLMKEKIDRNIESNLPLAEIVSKDIYSMLMFRKNSLLFSTISRESNNESTKLFLKLYDNEILTYIESQITKAIKMKKIKECDAHLTAFIIYKVYLSVMFEYDKELDELKVTEEITSVLKDGLFNK